MQIIIDSEVFIGTRENLIKVMEARGYQAERESRNPHLYFQYAEGLKAHVDGSGNSNNGHDEERKLLSRKNRKTFKQNQKRRIGKIEETWNDQKNQ